MRASRPDLKRSGRAWRPYVNPSFCLHEGFEKVGIEPIGGRTVRRRYFAILVLCAATAAFAVARPTAQATAGDKFWPQWRGPHANGVSRRANPPVEWSETKNIRWKVADSRPRDRLARRLGRPDLRPHRRAGGT